MDCDSLVIQSTMKNLWLKCWNKVKQQTAYQQYQGSPEEAIAIQIVFIDCDLFVIQFMMAICGKHHKQAWEQYNTNKNKSIQDFHHMLWLFCHPVYNESLWRKV